MTDTVTAYPVDNYLILKETIEFEARLPEGEYDKKFKVEIFLNPVENTYFAAVYRHQRFNIQPTFPKKNSKSDFPVGEYPIWKSCFVTRNTPATSLEEARKQAIEKVNKDYGSP